MGSHDQGRPGLGMRRADLRADCARCVALCCVAPAFSVSADFAIDKGAGEPCPNLQRDFRCAIHEQLRPSGFAGCTTYDCFGAGQRITQVLFPGRDWRSSPDIAPQMFAVLPVMRQLHELLWYLDEAQELVSDERSRAALRTARHDIERAAEGDPEQLLALDVAAHRQVVGVLLRRASEDVRSADATGIGGAGADRNGEDLIGADLRGADLRRASLRGVRLIGASLRGADLRGADLLGADLRGADLADTDLTGAIFLTPAQLEAADGDAHTRLSPGLERPDHWTT